nr:hypothetical protein CFP56_12764 [Quercus suber]
MFHYHRQSLLSSEYIPLLPAGNGIKAFADSAATIASASAFRCTKISVKTQYELKTKTKESNDIVPLNKVISGCQVYTTAKSSLPPKHFPMNTKVCALMTENGTSWDEDRIRGEFLTFEACEILSIPLSPRRPVDRRIWKETKNGVYYMKSAYRLLSKTANNNQPGLDA